MRGGAGSASLYCGFLPLSTILSFVAFRFVDLFPLHILVYPPLSGGENQLHKTDYPLLIFMQKIVER